MTHANTFPIVLAHGIARFDVLSNPLFRIGVQADDGLHYFRNIRTHLQARGFVVRHSNVEWARGLKIRSKTLKKELDRILAETGAEKVHIIAHSMGGLDARRALFHNRRQNFHRKVASLTTLGTPHHGSPFADFLVRKLGSLASDLGLAVEGVRDLTRRAAARFNEKAAAWEVNCGVRFRAYAGQQSLGKVFGPLKISWSLVMAEEGHNDGLVSVRSARWNDSYFVAPALNADQLNLLGWWDAGELRRGVSRANLEARIKRTYLEIARDLAKAFPLP